ncbi:hypothetical protein [Rubellimicrobium aerolatum]|uniref:Uncharacterized protein n=1 Tax=Rubellimicrobium aerolatum TaxID=490979 RepID=A0ABW0SGZ0_9RHOB|nr:hypothetical protein [Rubellimicrobium aerolatum]MBP1807614.1 hypothetical protein [Rubellimicrobium aerolatum]
MPPRKVSDLLGTSAPAVDAAKTPGRALVSTAAPPPSGVPGATPPDGTAALAAELNDLTRTLDVLATIVASVSDRVDGQTDALGKLTGTAAETRQAAFAARAQSDPGKLAAEVGQALDRVLLPRLGELSGAVERLGRMSEERNAYGKLQGQVMDLGRDLRHARERAALWRARLPGIGLAALLLVLALLVLMPRFVMAHPVGCRLLGGDWRDWSTYGDGTSCLFEWP